MKVPLTHLIKYGIDKNVALVLHDTAALEKTFVLIYIYKSDYLYLCPLFTPEPLDQSPPKFPQTSPSTQGRFLTQA